MRAASRLAHGGGSAFPGKIVERIDPQFLSRTLAQLPLGVVLVSGTNGKTTTTRMVASMLQSLGLKVFTNPTGSNFTRGVVSSLLAEVSLSGKLDADIAVLELDEAYAVHFVKQVPPDYCLLLNVMRDQLDRFGEIDNTARLLSKAAEATTGTVVLNREDPRIARLADVAHTEDGVEVRYFGLDESLRGFFPSDDDMSTTVDAEAHDSAEHGGNIGDSGNTGDTADAVAAAAPATSQPQDGPDALPADVTLRAVGDHRATFAIDGETYETAVKLEGVYNLYNAAAALAVVRAVAADAQAMFLPFEDALADSVDADGADTGTETDGNGSHDAIDQAAADEILRAAGVSPRMIAFAHATTQAMIDTAGEVTPAFGRGEVITVNGTPVELLLVKNPMGFRLSLASFKPEGCDTMICINDEYADGRDMSWLWDVDFTSLRGTGVKAVSGVRAWDMALRLEYDQVPVESVSTDLEESVVNFVNANSGTPQTHLLHVHGHAENACRARQNRRRGRRRRGQVSAARNETAQSQSKTAEGRRGDDMSQVIDIVSLYPKDMNIYGDSGNVLTIQRRLALYGYEPRVHAYNQGCDWPEHVDMILGGGGQDTGQKKIIDDFFQRADLLRSLAADGVPMLMICGLYQLFGEYFETVDGSRLDGIGVIGAYTVGQETRMIGNLTETSADFGKIIGYENHSGQTFLRDGVQPLGTVEQDGTGNNGEDHTEGARVHNVIGTYMHGSLLPKNPAIADFLIRTAVERRYGTFDPAAAGQTDAQRAALHRIDEIADRARRVAMSRPR